MLDSGDILGYFGAKIISKGSVAFLKGGDIPVKRRLPPGGIWYNLDKQSSI
jgi:hypothetical protein